jgi:hypothetical protein
MSGQDTSMISFNDSLVIQKEGFSEALFDGSQLVAGAIPDGGKLEMFVRLQVDQPAWLFLYLLVLLGFFSWIRLYYGNILTLTVQAATNFQVSSRMFKDNSLLQNQLDSILYALYLLSIAFFLLVVEIRLELAPYGLQGVLLYLFNLALLTGIFFGRMMIVNLSGFLFNQVDLFREYLYNAFIFNKLMGMTLLPLLLFMVYTNGLLKEIVFWMAMSAVALIVSMRIIRGIVFSFKKDVSIFYTILYLCALEIVPLVLLYRWLEGIL